MGNGCLAIALFLIAFQARAENPLAGCEALVDRVKEPVVLPKKKIVLRFPAIDETKPLEDGKIKVLPKTKIGAVEKSENSLNMASEHSLNDGAVGFIFTVGKVKDVASMLNELEAVLSQRHPGWRNNPRLVENFSLLYEAAKKNKLNVFLKEIISFGDDESTFTAARAEKNLKDPDAPIKVDLTTGSTLGEILHELDHAAEFLRHPKPETNDLERYAMATDRKATGREVIQEDYSYGPMATILNTINYRGPGDSSYVFSPPEIPEKPKLDLLQQRLERQQGIVRPREPLFIPAYDSIQTMALQMLRLHRRVQKKLNPANPQPFYLEESGAWSRFSPEQQKEVKKLFKWARDELQRIEDYNSKPPPAPTTPK